MPVERNIREILSGQAALSEADQTKRLVEATVKVEVTHLPFTTTISNEIQALLLSDENISQYGKFRLQSISFGKENGINIRDFINRDLSSIK